MIMVEFKRGVFMDNLYCENVFCIYQKDGKCILDIVNLDIQGNCVDCTYIDIEPTHLNELKQKNCKN